MPMNLTFCYITARRQPSFEWFWLYLKNQCPDICNGTPLIIVDNFPDIHKDAWAPFLGAHGTNWKWVEPKPNVWQGNHRLTMEDWFAVANARNTGLALCKTNWICYVDDLSVPLSGWFEEVADAITRPPNIVTLGAYRKVKNLVVEDGKIVSFSEHKGGEDNRLRFSPDGGPCKGEWLYGCSLVAPVEALLAVDGWPEMLCDGMGAEDTAMGQVLENNGTKFIYNPKMMTYESEEGHHVGPRYRKEDMHHEQGVLKYGGNGSTDKSHAALNICRDSKTFYNGFGEGGMRALRQRTLAGEPFPIKRIPEHEWYSGIPLKDL